MSVNETTVRTSTPSEGMVKSMVWDVCNHDGGIRAFWSEEDATFHEGDLSRRTEPLIGLGRLLLGLGSHQFRPQTDSAC